jgi:hypothetical protein
MKWWAGTGGAVLVTLLGGILPAGQKTESIRYSPKEIRLELSTAEAQTSGGRHWGRIMILDGRDGNLRVTGVQTSPNLLAMVYDLTYRWPGGASMHAFRVETRLKPVEQPGTFEEWVKLSTNHPDVATFRIPITYRVCPSVRAVPKALVINRFLDEEATRKVRLTTSAAAGLEIGSVAAADPWLSARASRVDPNTVDVEVALAESSVAAKHVLQSTITARTLRPEKSEVTIPVVFLPRLAVDGPALLSVIALSNRLNSELLESFRCRYACRLRLGARGEINQAHEYAFAGLREYHRIEIVGSERRDPWLYMKNDGLAYARMPGLIDLVAKRSQGPFEAISDAGGGVIPSLDRLNPKYSKVDSVKEGAVDGRRCAVVEVEQSAAGPEGKGPDHILTMWFSIEDGFLPVRVEARPPQKASPIDAWVRHAVVTKILTHRIQGGTIRVPMEFRSEVYRNEKLENTMELTMEPESIEINPALPDEMFRVEPAPDDIVIDRGLVATPRETPEQISIPGNRDFYNARTGFTSEQGGSMEVKTLFGQELGRFWGMSLKGGPLPSWDGIQLDLKNESLPDRAVLVCFWDMSQRPSRRCLDVLAEHAESLKQKNVAIITVQTTKVDAPAWQAWVKEHNVPGAAGIVTGDAGKVRAAWAVASLPWLILADGRHVVRAEGFGVEGLTEALSTLSAP